MAAAASMTVGAAMMVVGAIMLQDDEPAPQSIGPEVSAMSQASSPDVTAGTQPSSSTRVEASTIGDDPRLDTLWVACERGDFEACDDLYRESPIGSDYEAFGDTCGGRSEPTGWCGVPADLGAATSTPAATSADGMFTIPVPIGWDAVTRTFKASTPQGDFTVVEQVDASPDLVAYQIDRGFAPVRLATPGFTVIAVYDVEPGGLPWLERTPADCERVGLYESVSTAGGAEGSGELFQCPDDLSWALFSLSHPAHPSARLYFEAVFGTLEQEEATLDSLTRLSMP